MSKRPTRDPSLEAALRAFYEQGVVDPRSGLGQRLMRLGFIEPVPAISPHTYAITPAGKDFLGMADDDDWQSVGEGYPPMDTMPKELYACACAAFDVLAPVDGEGARAFTGSLGVGFGPLSLGDGSGEVLVWGNETNPRVEQVWRIAQMVTAAVLKRKEEST